MVCSLIRWQDKTHNPKEKPTLPSRYCSNFERTRDLGLFRRPCSTARVGPSAVSSKLRRCSRGYLDINVRDSKCAVNNRSTANQLCHNVRAVGLVHTAERGRQVGAANTHCGRVYSVCLTKGLITESRPRCSPGVSARTGLGFFMLAVRFGFPAFSRFFCFVFC